MSRLLKKNDLLNVRSYKNKKVNFDTLCLGDCKSLDTHPNKMFPKSKTKENIELHYGNKIRSIVLITNWL